MSNQISPFEYVSILVCIMMGLGITQVLSAFSDLLYDFKKVIFYWPNILWIVFIFFLHIQDWFITWQLRSKMVWHLPEQFLFFGQFLLIKFLNGHLWAYNHFFQQLLFWIFN